MVVLEAGAFAKPVLLTDACKVPAGFAGEAANRVGTAENGLLEGLRQLEAASDEDLRAMGERERQLAPVNEVATHSVTPAHVPPFVAERIVLKKDVPLPVVEDQSVRVIHPVPLGREMELWPTGFSL